jgi:hypothetical protein
LIQAASGKLGQELGPEGLGLRRSGVHAEDFAAAVTVLHASWQRCRVHYMCDVLAHTGGAIEFSLSDRSG